MHRLTRPLALLGAGLLLAACATGPSAPDAGGAAAATVQDARRAGETSGETATPTPTPVYVPPELPRGGRELFPRYRLVGFCGTPGAPALGPLADSSPAGLDVAAGRLAELSPAYANGREVLPVFELIAVVVQRSPGADGMHRFRQPDDVVQTYLDLARRHRGLLLLNIQPGRSPFLAEVQAYEKFLTQPDVGLALDPEWAVGPGQRPGRVYGRTSGAELDQVAAYLSGLVARHDLPEKVLLFHQVAPSVVQDEGLLTPKPGVVVIKSVDGIGPAASKVATWTGLTATMPGTFRSGFKLFFTEDTRGGAPLMTPAEVLALVPTPDYVMYE